MGDRFAVHWQLTWRSEIQGGAKVDRLAQQLKVHLSLACAQLLSRNSTQKDASVPHHSYSTIFTQSVLTYGHVQHFSTQLGHVRRQELEVDCMCSVAKFGSSHGSDSPTEVPVREVKYIGEKLRDE